MAHSLIKGATIVAAALLGGVAAPASGEAPSPKSYKTQLGVGPAAPFNMEEPFINLAKGRPADWTYSDRGKGAIGGAKAIEAGLGDPDSWMPTPESNKAQYAAVAMFLPGAQNYASYYADTYVLDWKGKARGMMQRWDGKIVSTRKDNSVTYVLRPQQVTGGSMRFTSVGDDFSDIRLYRKKYEDRLNRGEIWNPEFINYVKRYDIVRTLDLQGLNNSNVRRFDQIATMDEPWGQKSSMAQPEPPFFHIPYEALFNLGVEAGVEMWVLIPPEIGAPMSHADASFRNEKNGKFNGRKLAAATAANVDEILASPEWDNFAKEFVDRYVKSGYPQSRPLYIEIGNEIWNFAGGFAVSSNYAIGIGNGVNPEWKIGHGYGVLVAREMMAFEKEFARRGIKPNVTYIVATHTANPWRTKQALDGLAGYLKMKGEDPRPYLAKTGVAATNYYGHFHAMSQALFGVDKPAEYAPLWEDAIRKDPGAFAKRVSDVLTDGAPNIKGTGPWIIRQFREHQKYAEEGGSRFIGSYEGGSHLVPPPELMNSSTFMKWWNDWHWGEGGAAVGRRINGDILAAFPGVILTNYRAIGDPNARYPWVEGHYAKPTPPLEMWDEFTRAGRAK